MYGAGDPTIWWRIPEPELRPFIAMMPRLLAEQSRARIDELVVASGRMLKDNAYREFMAGLDRRVDGEESRPTRRAPKLSLDQMQRAGIRVVRQDKVAVSSVTTTKPGERPGLKRKPTAEALDAELDQIDAEVDAMTDELIEDQKRRREVSG